MKKFYNLKHEVGVIVSHGYGAGWSTWGKNRSCFDPTIITAILAGNRGQKLEEIAKKVYPDEYTGGLSDNPEVYFVPQGQQFIIEEYDGAESLTLKDDIEFLTA